MEEETYIDPLTGIYQDFGENGPLAYIDELTETPLLTTLYSSATGVVIPTIISNELLITKQIVLEDSAGTFWTVKINPITGALETEEYNA